MMRDTKTLDKLPATLEAMNEVVTRGGFGTSVTPVSQFYFQQAFNNVMFGKWKKIADGYGKMLLGYFGKTPVTPDAELIELAAKQLGLEPTTKNPLDIADADPSKSLANFKKILLDEDLPLSDENIFITATCAEKGIAFLKGLAKVSVRKVDHIQEKIEKTERQQEEETHINFDAFNLKVDGVVYEVWLRPDESELFEAQYKASGLDYDLISKAKDLSATNLDIEEDGLAHVRAPLPASIMQILVQPGDKVTDGQDVVILEAMKMVVETQAPINGVVKAVHIKVGDTVDIGQSLITIE
jgi:pyruvate carboxylase subunit B